MYDGSEGQSCYIFTFNSLSIEFNKFNNFYKIELLKFFLILQTWKATKGLSSHDWCRNFEISFIGEQGIDWGGLRREWFEQVCSRLFEGKSIFLSHDDFNGNDSNCINFNGDIKRSLWNYDCHSNQWDRNGLDRGNILFIIEG